MYAKQLKRDTKEKRKEIERKNRKKCLKSLAMSIILCNFVAW